MSLRLVTVPAAKEATGPVIDPLADLAAAATAGDGRAVQALVVSVMPAMLRAMRGVLGAGHPDIEDILQESAIGLVASLKSFRRECTVLHFACRIAVLTALAARRRLRARGDAFREPLDTPLSSDDSSPQQLLLVARRRAVLRSLCDTLPDVQSEALILHCVLGFTVEEVADASQVPPNTVRSRLRLAKEALRDEILADPSLRETLEASP